MGNMGRGPASPYGRKLAQQQAGKPAVIDGAEARKTADLLTEPATVTAPGGAAVTHEAEAGEVSKSWTEAAGGPGADPAAKPLCESPSGGKLGEAVSTVDGVMLESWLWLPVALGGGDVAMLCKFTEAQINLVRVKAEEQAVSEGEVLQELFARAFEHAWL